MKPRRLSRAIIGAGLVTFLTLSMGGTATAQDSIDDLQRQIEQAERQQSEIDEEIGNLGGKQSDLEERQGDLDASLEGLDADIADKIRELNSLQDQLPGAQEALTAAEGQVSAAAAEVQSLNERVRQAESSRSEILAEIAASEQELDEASTEIGQIANQAYKQGGVSSDLAFILGMSDSSLPDAMGLANQAMRIQNSRISTVSQSKSTDVNAEVRLAAVETEIRDLRAQAEEALQREEQARDAAAAAKRELDQMVSTTSQLTDELKAQRPQIQAQIDANRAAQDQVNAQIAERQRELTAQAGKASDLQEQHRAAVAEAERKRREAEEAARKARQASAANRAAAQASAEKAEREASAAEDRASEAEKAASTSNSWGLQWPLNTYITSGFGWRPTPSGTFDYGGAGGYVHTGMDFGGGCGLPIRASADGEVWNADWAVWTSGKRVVISHGVVNGRALATKYHHMTRYIVSPGQNVKRGQIIGYTGTTGNSTGCHLHFETILDGQAVNPAGLL
ncbi:metalloendopeptidase [Citricoccus zhacaiensis]|uniref:Metalloendopeptidase n=1 Tax=Citricoccus zhacaiensis TaxID=489142 RepID=A0ABQ2LMR9_9MICC|nr:M23 family metallopeptidase [Citricoccus zhacaiensis]GGO40249.1 metalloendopeptidase [Citricoccus zhacaiensis]